MDPIEINAGFLLAQVFNLLIVLVWPMLSLLALFSLRGRQLTQTAQAIWVLLIVVVPLLGPLAFWFMRPGEGGVGSVGRR